MAGGVRDGIVVFGVRLRNAGAGNAFNLLGVGEAVLLTELAQVPPLKMKGQPERTRDSSKERARMAFSTRGVSSIPGIFCFAC